MPRHSGLCAEAQAVHRQLPGSNPVSGMMISERCTGGEYSGDGEEGRQIDGKGRWD